MVVVGGKKDWKAEGPEKVRVDSLWEESSARVGFPGRTALRPLAVRRSYADEGVCPASQRTSLSANGNCGNAEMRKCGNANGDWLVSLLPGATDLSA